MSPSIVESVKLGHCFIHIESREFSPKSILYLRHAETEHQTGESVHVAQCRFTLDGDFDPQIQHCRAVFNCRASKNCYSHK